MAEATLALKGDSSSIVRALGQIEGVSRQARTAVIRDWDQAARSTEQSFSRLAIAGQRAFAAIATAESRVATGRMRMEQLATTVALAQSAKRTEAAKKEAVARGEATTELTKTVSRLESLITQTTEQESRRRIALARREASEVVQSAQGASSRVNGLARRGGRAGAGGGADYGYGDIGSAMLNGAGGAAMGAFRIMGQVANASLARGQSVRERRAESGHDLNSAFYQAGAGAEDAAALRRRVYDFAWDNRMDSTEIAAAANATQTEFSSLGDSHSTQAQRVANTERFLGNALLARNTGQDVSEVTRVAGMLENAGIRGPENRAALLGLTGMAQRGAIELGAVSRTAMAPMQARMGQARANWLRDHAGADPDAPGNAGAIAQAEQSEAMRAFAEIEVGRGLGWSARRMGTTMAGLNTSLQSSTVQARILNNVRNAAGQTDAQRHAAEEALFTGDAEHRVLRHTAGIEFAADLSRGFGGDVVAMQNTLTGGGHGNPMSLGKPQRDALAAIVGSGGATERLLAGVGTDFTEGDVNRGANLFGNEDKTVLAGEHEQSDSITANTQATMDNTRALSAFASAHPELSDALKALPGGDALVANVATSFGAVGRRREDATTELAERAVRGERADLSERGITDQMGVIARDEARSMGMKAAGSSAEKSAASPEQLLRAMTRALENVRLHISPMDTHQLLLAGAQAAQGGNSPPPESRR